ncbi:MAG: hypothetical protein U5N56_06520 [Candidatus Marinimicrobia bacterium]|nr:hypothetical protein [Candidatus Neomarinimicrobiota bacterium]
MEKENSQVVQTKEWLLTYLIVLIPLVNIIMLFVWAFGSTTKLSKANWAKASLIWFVIVFVFYILIFVVIGVSTASLY